MGPYSKFVKTRYVCFPIKWSYGILLLFLFLSPTLVLAQYTQKLWYTHPADGWLESVPLGNGRLGAMPDGGVFNETVVLNDITLWSGGPQDANRPKAYKALPKIRRLIFEGKNAKAQKLVTKKFLCKGRGSAHARAADAPYGSYQVLGFLHLKYDYGVDPAKVRPANYYRDLSLDSAMARTRFTLNGVTYRRTYFTSFASDVIIIRLTASQPGKINVTLSLDRPENAQTVTRGKELDMFGRLNNGTNGKGMRYMARVRIKHDGGRLISRDSTLQIKNADVATVYISAGTDFWRNSYKQKTAHLLHAALNQPYQQEVAAHVKAYQQLFGRASFALKNMNLKQAKLPTKKRLKTFAKNPTDYGLPVLYFNFGRYLLISSTRPGGLPPNLQGLWANTIQTPWNGDYHLDINIEMNHWPGEVTNLPMLNQPFYLLTKRMVEPGRKTAQAYFNSPGWVAFVVTNIWSYTAPGEGASWGSAMSGSGWLSQVLWTHYAFTLDKEYLKKIYPIIKGAANFYLHALARDPNNGWLVTAPSESPENSFYLANGKVAAISAGPTMDNQIIRELFTHVIEANEILNKNSALTKKLAYVRSQLPPNQIDKHGRLMEWLKPYKEVDPHHRHLSPLWGLYPGIGITQAEAPKIAKAAKKLLIRRGDKSTGWSEAWKMNLWARLEKGNHAYKLLTYILNPALPNSKEGHTYPNLFDAINGYGSPFQIDANFGATAGIAEMLVQSHNGYIEFLPALSDQWPEGHFTGFRVRGGGVVSAQWENGMLTNATLRATVAHKFKILIPAKLKHRMKLTVNGKTTTPDWRGNLLMLSMQKGVQVEMKF